MGIDMGIPAVQAKGLRWVLQRLRGTGAALFAALCALALPACAHLPTGSLAVLEVYDRQESAVLPVYVKDGQRYVAGTPGHEYTLRVRNLTGERVLAVMSVDGVNVVSGETAAPEQSGYVLEPYGSVDVTGWRKSLSHSAAFYFTDLGDSYAARTGRPRNVGVIGLAVFRERPPPYRAQIMEKRERVAASAAAAEAGRDSPAAPAQASPLGTGHGRDEQSYVTRVAFERASTSPADVFTVRYDRRDNLIAMGVLPAPAYAQREPDPFPGRLRFVPDPR